MDTILHRDQEGAQQSTLPVQAISFFLHAGLALGTWVLLMLAGYALNPPAVSQSLILVVSLAVPLVVGHLVNRFRQDEMAPVVWLLGLIWLMIFALWILDMPTRPDACFQCGAAEKLTRTFFSLPSPSGLIDNDGPFLATWPAAALIGYGVGARLAMRRKPKAIDE
jgi:hypothetical protein